MTDRKHSWWAKDFHSVQNRVQNVWSKKNYLIKQYKILIVLFSFACFLEKNTTNFFQGHQFLCTLKFTPSCLHALIRPVFPKCNWLQITPFPAVLSLPKSTSINLVAKNICNFFCFCWQLLISFSVRNFLHGTLCSQFWFLL